MQTQKKGTVHSMRNLKLTIAFDGRNYAGFQVQKNALTVSEVFSNAVERVFEGRLPIKGCSRTDSGVHAEGYVLTFHTERNIPVERVVAALNVHLPSDVAVLDCVEVPTDFHARYSAVSKEYVYKIHNSRVRNPFMDRLVLEYGRQLNEQSMHKNAQDFIGTHDFAAFMNKGSPVDSTVRTIFSFDVRRDGDMVELAVKGDGFLYNMVRIMVGTLLNIENGVIKSGTIPDIIGSQNRKNAGDTAPPQGLYLHRVYY